MSQSKIDNHFNKIRWTISNKTNIPLRQRSLDLLGVDDPDEAYEEDYPIILVNKTYSARTMADKNKFSFYRNFRKTVLNQGLDIWDPMDAKKLIGKKLETKFIQMRKLNTDVRFWAPDRIGISLK